VREVFADTFYWAAMLNPSDPDYQRAQEVGRSLEDAKIITTDEVLIELLTYFSGAGSRVRAGISGGVQALLISSQVEVLMQSRETFLAGLQLYAARPDKEYSGVDAISMAVMKARGINEVLTHDHHFAQEGFVLLL
jgi:predicted nucleic acid-binding protein